MVRSPITAMTLRILSLALLLSTSLLSACDEGGDDGPNVDCATAAVPKFSEMTAAWSKCTACHSSALSGDARQLAPTGINFDNYADARTHASKAMDEVYGGDMPLPGNPPLTAAEKTQIYNWASCDTPE